MIKPILCITSAKLEDIYIKRGEWLLSLTYSHAGGDVHGYGRDGYVLNDYAPNDSPNFYFFFFCFLFFILWAVYKYFKRFILKHFYGHACIPIHAYGHGYGHGHAYVHAHGHANDHNFCVNY